MSDAHRARMMSKVRLEPGPLETPCWVWTKGRWCDGRYGQTSQWGAAPRKNINAHRLSYLLFVGPIPEGLHLDHLCRNGLCCNPGHVEPVPCKVNINRGNVALRMLAREVCPKGHRYEGHNIIWVRARSGNPARHCRKCVYARNEARRSAKRRAARDMPLNPLPVKRTR